MRESVCKPVFHFSWDDCSFPCKGSVQHFSHRAKHLDSLPTPLDSLERAYQIGKDAGLRYVYLGNVPGTKSESTFCYKCNKTLIERIGYTIAFNHIMDSKCPDCGTEIAGFGL